jgi:hypothetical protein
LILQMSPASSEAIRPATAARSRHVVFAFDDVT